MQLTLNGQPYSFTGETIAQLIDELGLTGRLAVEVNREIIPRSEHGTFRLQESDTVEIVHAIGGG